MRRLKFTREETTSLLLEIKRSRREGLCIFCDKQGVVRCRTCKRKVCKEHILADGNCGLKE